MSTPHINAEKGDFAKTVLMPGDPYRAEFIAKNFLDNARLVNDVRAVRGYTGTYKGAPVSVMASGMGMPSIGIYSYELFNFFDVENIIRIGSAGSYSEHVKLRDIGIAEGACKRKFTLIAAKKQRRIFIGRKGGGNARRQPNRRLESRNRPEKRGL